MEIIKNQNHPKETLFFALSRMLERASYYGFRSILILHIVGDTLNMERNEAAKIYGLFSGSIIFSQIIGALFGDLLIGNRKSVIIGGIIQSIGAFSLCIPSTTGLYLGIFLIVLGSGFFTPNLISNFGKLYLNRIKLLDSGFTIFYLTINLGAFLGAFIIGIIGNTFGYNIGFFISGILMLLSIVPVLLSKEKVLDEFEKTEFSINKQVSSIIIAFFTIGLFWGIYEIADIQIINLQSQFSEISTLDIPQYFWHSINVIFILPISIIAIILWTVFYSNQFFKLMLGFIFGTISFAILFLIPKVSTEQHLIIYLLSLLFLGISEIHIAPIIHSILTKYSNPKYLAILISLSFLPTKLILLISGLFNDRLYSNPMLGLKIGIIAMIIIGIALIGYVLWDKIIPVTTSKQNQPET